MWKFTELREMYKKGGWKESHFIVRPQIQSKNSTYSVNSNTIERPIASQQADRSSSIRNLRAISTSVPQTMIQVSWGKLSNARRIHSSTRRRYFVRLTNSWTPNSKHLIIMISIPAVVAPVVVISTVRILIKCTGHILITAACKWLLSMVK